MRLEEYQACLNLVGEAGYALQRVTHVTDTPHTSGEVVDALELARLALHALIGAISREAERQYPWDEVCAALGDPGAMMEQLEYQMTQDLSTPCWEIAGTGVHPSPAP